MDKHVLNKIINIAEDQNWKTNYDLNDQTMELRKYSSVGQDFSINVNCSSLNGFLDDLKDQYNNYDVSEETYLWLDNRGHGVNGAPYDMKDVYEDMEECREFISLLIKEIQYIKRNTIQKKFTNSNNC